MKYKVDLNWKLKRPWYHLSHLTLKDAIINRFYFTILYILKDNTQIDLLDARSVAYSLGLLPTYTMPKHTPQSAINKEFQKQEYSKINQLVTRLNSVCTIDIQNDFLVAKYITKNDFEALSKYNWWTPHAHPEQRDNEVFLGNLRKNRRSGYKTIRFGNVPYYASGEPIQQHFKYDRFRADDNEEFEESFPAFVNVDEFIKNNGPDSVIKL